MEVFVYVIDKHSLAVEVTEEESKILDLLKISKLQIHSIAFHIGFSVRETWKIIADMRLKGIPLIGDKGGVWLSTCSKEIDGYTKYQVKKARKTIQSEFAIINSLRESARINQIPLFEEKRGFFNRLFT